MGSAGPTELGAQGMLGLRRGGVRGRSGGGRCRPGGTALRAVPSPPFTKNSALFYYWNEHVPIEPSNTVRAPRSTRCHLGFDAFHSQRPCTGLGREAHDGTFSVSKWRVVAGVDGQPVAEALEYEHGGAACGACYKRAARAAKAKAEAATNSGGTPSEAAGAAGTAAPQQCLLGVAGGTGEADGGADVAAAAMAAKLPHPSAALADVAACLDGGAVDAEPACAPPSLALVEVLEEVKNLKRMLSEHRGASCSALPQLSLLLPSSLRFGPVRATLELREAFDVAEPLCCDLPEAVFELPGARRAGTPPRGLCHRHADLLFHPSLTARSRASKATPLFLYRPPPARILRGPDVNAPSGRPAYTLVLADPAESIPFGAPRDVASFMKRLRDLKVVDPDAGLVQAGLFSCQLTKPDERSKEQQAALAADSFIKYAFDMLKARAFMLLCATDRNPDEYRFDKIVHLLGVRGGQDQDIHFDDAWLLMLVMYMFPTKPTMVATSTIPTFGEAVRWVEQHEANNGSDVFSRMSHWPLDMIRLWLPLFVNIMRGCLTDAPVKVVTATSCILVEAGVPHNAPKAPYPDFDPTIPAGERSSVFATIKKLSGPVVLGSFLAQDLGTLHETADVGSKGYPVNQQFSALSSSYYAGCADTFFNVLRTCKRVKGDEPWLFFDGTRREVKVLEEIFKLPSGVADASPQRKRKGRANADQTETSLKKRFKELWCAEPLQLMHMETERP